MISPTAKPTDKRRHREEKDEEYFYSGKDSIVKPVTTTPQNDTGIIQDIRNIMLACVEDNEFSDDYSVEEMLMKNQTMRVKLSILISAVEHQLAAMGHDISSFFNSITDSNYALDSAAIN